MAGLDNYTLNLIKALAENRIQDAKNYAITCCINDNTQKNASSVNYYKKLLQNGSVNMYELPVDIKGLINMVDVSTFNENRYYLGDKQRLLFEQIENGVRITEKMLEYGIPYRNSTIIYGKPGTGKTEFAKYVAYKLGLPYAYLNFSFLIESYMGKTSKNIQRVFDFCKGQKCVLMLDEIDCIGLKRGSGEGVDGELARTTISLMQALDGLVDGQIIISATNREDRIDEALKRRFQRSVEFVNFSKDERLSMINKYINSIDAKFMTEDIINFAIEDHSQAEIVKFIIDSIARSI